MGMLRQTNNESGMTLLEVLLSIVLLSIIIVSFLTMFAQSAKINSKSSDLTDATFYAQKYMEKLYHWSTETPFEEFKEKLTADEGFMKQGDNWTKNEGSYIVKVTITTPEDGISKALVYVYKGEVKQSNLEAQMETRLLWRN